MKKIFFILISLFQASAVAEPSNQAFLYSAVSIGDIEKIQSSIENGVDINLKNKEKETLLHFAITYRQWEIARLLIENGADINAKTAAKETPLHFVSKGEEENLETAQLLIDKGADVNAKNREENTPLNLAIKWGNAERAHLFIENGRGYKYKK